MSRNPTHGKYQLRLDPRFKDKIELMDGYRKIEGAKGVSKHSVVEEAIDLYYEVLKERHDNAEKEEQ